MKKKKSLSIVIMITLLIGSFIMASASGISNIGIYNSNYDIEIINLKTNYKVGEAVSLQGRVLDGQEGVADVNVSMVLISPDQTPIVVEQKSTDGNGIFNLSFNISQSAVLGTYELQLKAVGIEKSFNFDVVENVEDSEYIIEIFDLKQNYKQAQAVSLEGRVLYINEGVANVNVTMTLKNPQETIVVLDQYTTDENGFFDITFNISQDAILGVYELKLNSVGIEQNFTFEIVEKDDGIDYTTTIKTGAIGKIVEVKLDVDNPEEYTVLALGEELFYSPTRKLFVGLFDSTKQESEIKESVLIQNQPIAIGNYLKYGDLTNTGRINILDVDRTIQLALGNISNPSKKEQLAADIDGNGRINIIDVDNIIQAALGNITLFPIEQ